MRGWTGFRASCQRKPKLQALRSAASTQEWQDYSRNLGWIAALSAVMGGRMFQEHTLPRQQLCAVRSVVQGQGGGGRRDGM